MTDLTDAEHAANQATNAYLCRCHPVFVATHTLYAGAATTVICSRCERPRR